jgi:hypothetical protein
MDGFKSPFGPLYSLSHPELDEHKRWLDEDLSKYFIHTSPPPATTLILFVTKGDGCL